MNRIPDELKQLKQWVVWGVSPDKPKLPYNPAGMNPAKAGEAKTWADFETAEKAVKAGRAQGVGFEFNDTGLYGVDLDHVLEDGRLRPEAQTVVDLLNSYTEISPSGTGLHILVKSAPLQMERNRKDFLEIYHKGRYFTMTGNIYGEYREIADRTEELEAVYAAFLEPPKPESPQAPATPGAVPDDSYLQTGLEKDRKFQDLWNGGRPNGNESADDLALMNKLAYWCSRNPELMREAFAASPHCRSKDPEHQKKAARPDYIERTVREALAKVTATAEADNRNFKASQARKDFGADGSGTEKPEKKKLKTISARELQDKDIPPIDFVIDNFLPQGLGMLVAAPKVGKSWLVLDMCLAVAIGLEFLGHGTNQCECLYLALEDSERRLKDRMNKILKGRRAPEGFHYATSASDIANGLIEELEGFISEHPKTGLIVIDTLEKVRPANAGKDSAYSKDYKDVGALKKFADQHNICLFMVHHVRKMSDDSDPFNRISGTNGILGAVDTALIIEKASRDSEEAKLSITGRDVEGNSIIIKFDKEDYRWKVVGDAFWLEAERARLQYNDDPIVKTVKALLDESPEGWRGTATDLLNQCRKISGQLVTTSAQSLTAKIKKLEGPFWEYDRIVHSTGRSGSGSRLHVFECRENSDTWQDVTEQESMDMVFSDEV